MNKSLCLTVTTLLLAAGNLSAATLYVSLDSTNPSPPYAAWATAATNIQDAVDAAAASDVVVVTNGMYAGGVAVTNPLSALRLLSAATAGTNVTVTWQSVAGADYSLERSASLASPFTLLATNILGQAGTTTYADTNATGAGLFFYRVGVNAQ